MPVVYSAARPKVIRELTLDDIDLPGRRVTLASHRQPLSDLTHNALLAWLRYRRATWPGTANRHVLISRISALGTGPVSADYLDKQQPRGICLERTGEPRQQTRSHHPDTPGRELSGAGPLRN